VWMMNDRSWKPKRSDSNPWVRIICMHLGTHLGTKALRASDCVILGRPWFLHAFPTVFFSDWSPVNSNNFGDIAADRITVCHGIFRQCPRFQYSF
jgi:hypothetical protein